jgi:hypothetical protein
MNLLFVSLAFLVRTNSVAMGLMHLLRQEHHQSAQNNSENN